MQRANGVRGWPEGFGRVDVEGVAPRYVCSPGTTYLKASLPRDPAERDALCSVKYGVHWGFVFSLLHAKIGRLPVYAPLCPDKKCPGARPVAGLRLWATGYMQMALGASRSPLMRQR